MHLIGGKSTQTDHHSGFNSVRSHENGLFLYKSNQAEDFVKSRIMDYFLAGSIFAWSTNLIGGFGLGTSSFLFLPIFVTMCALPRKLAAV